MPTRLVARARRAQARYSVQCTPPSGTARSFRAPCLPWSADCDSGQRPSVAKKQAHALLADFVAAMTTHLKQGDRVRMSGLGILEVKSRAARAGCNPGSVSTRARRRSGQTGLGCGGNGGSGVRLGRCFGAAGAHCPGLPPVPLPGLRQTVNECSAGLLNRTQFPSDVIALQVLWRLRYKLSLRDLSEMFLIRGTCSAIRRRSSVGQATATSIWASARRPCSSTSSKKALGAVEADFDAAGE